MQFKNMSVTRKLSVILVIACVILIIGHELKLYLPDLELWVEKLGIYAPLGFIAIFVVLTPFFCISRYLVFCSGFVILNRGC